MWFCTLWGVGGRSTSGRGAGRGGRRGKPSSLLFHIKAAETWASWGDGQAAVLAVGEIKSDVQISPHQKVQGQQKH